MVTVADMLHDIVAWQRGVPARRHQCQSCFKWRLEDDLVLEFDTWFMCAYGECFKRHQNAWRPGIIIIWDLENVGFYRNVPIVEASSTRGNDVEMAEATVVD